ncbi:MAG: DUF560 domain-containing protein [Magnetococcales bacterium]|nr:DUF560 domain-containing protein [Magnetococcales bacterium]
MAMDDQDLEAINHLSSAQLGQFNRKLRQAMALYYDNAYPLALPLFRELAAQVPTLDILYWYGLTALRSQQPDLAVTKFQAMLDRNPDLHQVRLEKASALMQLGELERARGELEMILAANPSDGVRMQAEKTLSQMAGVDKRFYANLRLAMGVQYDSNINVRSDDLPTVLDTPQEKGLGFPVTATVDLLLDVGEKEKWAWRNRLNIYRIDYDGLAAFDYSQFDLATGLEYFATNHHLKLPAGLITRHYGHDDLSDAWYLAPEVNWALNDRLNLKVGYRFEEESFDDTANQDQDNHSHTFSLTPIWQLDTPQPQVISLLGNHTRKDAQTSQFTYDAWGIAPTWFAHFEELGVDTYLQAKLSYRAYEGNAVNVTGTDFPDEREDRRMGVTAMVNKTFDETYMVSASYSFVSNDSNTTIYDYDKSVFGLNFGVNLHN